MFARPLHVNVAYHSHFIGEVTSRYQELITPHLSEFDCQSAGPLMFSSLTGRIRDLEVDAHYWAKNMASIVRFDEALTQLVLDTNVSIDFLVEIGPSGALAGPVKQVLEQAGRHQDVTYTPAFARGKDAIRSLVECAGRAFIAGTDVNILRVNAIDERSRPAVLVDLPNYSWDRSQEYWYESESSADWRNRLHPHHELLGSKVLGTSWQEPTWKNTLRLQDLPWLADHRASRSPWLMMFRADIEAQIGSDILFPATGFIAMAIEAIQQQHEALTGLTSQTSLHGVRLRDVKFDRALPFLPGSDVRIRLTLRPRTGGKSEWHEYNIASFALEKWQEHSSGLIRRAHSEEASHCTSNHGLSDMFWMLC